jgi:hypothetical protein
MYVACWGADTRVDYMYAGRRVGLCKTLPETFSSSAAVESINLSDTRLPHSPAHLHTAQQQQRLRVSKSASSPT